MGRPHARRHATAVLAASLLLTACGGGPGDATDGEAPAVTADAAAPVAATDDTGPSDEADPTPESDEVDPIPDDGHAPVPTEVDGHVTVDGEEVALRDRTCGPVGGGATWRVAASFDLEPHGRFLFDVRSQLTEDGEPDWEGTTTDPNATLQWPDDGDEDEDAYEFLTADRLFRGGDTTELEISFAGASGEIEVERQVVREAEVARSDEIDGQVRLVTFDLTCPGA